MRALPVGFTGSGEGLRRHARRDLLINIVLGGLYTSVARRRAAEYLTRCTIIDDTPIVHASLAHSRWPAILLAAAFVALRVASEFGWGPPLPLLIAGGVLLLPWLWATVVARTVGALRWRELQLAFDASWRDVYLASWPLLVLGGAWAIAQPQVAALASAPDSLDARWLPVAAAAGAVAFPLLARVAFNFQRLRFTGTRVGGAQVSWAAGFPAYLRLWLLTAAGVLATAVAPVLLLRRALLGSISLEDLPVTEAVLVYCVALILVWVLSAPARAWYEARHFILTWNGLRVADTAKVECALDARAFVRMRTADAWRTFATFGFHAPQAAVRAYRAKLASLTVWSA